MYDERDINKVDLKKLRRSITYIPQDPSLFEDTLRKNLDPTDSYSDENIIQTLESLDIWEKFRDQNTLDEAGLEFKIEKDSKNLSQGEKQ